MAQAQTSSSAPRVFRKIQEIWNIPESEKATAHRLEVECFVDFHDPDWKLLWLRDLGGRSVYVPLGKGVLPLKSGQRVRLVGTYSKESGLEAGQVVVHVLEENASIAVRRFEGDLSELATAHGERVSVAGVASNATLVDATHLRLELHTGEHVISATVAITDRDPLPGLIKGYVRVEGTLVITPNAKGSVAKAEVLVPASRFVTLTESQPAATKTSPLKVEEPKLAGNSDSRQLPVIRRVQDIWAIPAEDKQRAHPLELECVIDYYDYSWKLLWARDVGSTAAFIPVASTELRLKPGQRVAIRGTYVPAEGLAAGRVSIRVLDNSYKLQPKRFDEDTSELAAANAEWVSVEGFVNSIAEVGADHLRLQLATMNHLVTVHVLVNEADPMPNFANAFVRVEGTAVVTPDAAGNVSRVDVWVPGARYIAITRDIRFDKRFELPEVPILSLTDAAAGKRVRVKGTLHSFTPGESLVLRDDGGQVEIKSLQVLALVPGQVIEAIGDLKTEGVSQSLTNAWFRVASGDVRGMPAPRRSVLRLANQVVSLSPEDAAAGQPASIRGLVTWSSPNANFFFFADASGGLCVHLGPNMQRPNMQDRVRVNGVSAAGPFAPVLHAESMEPPNGVGLPVAVRIPFEQALTGVEENRWVILEGYVREVKQDGPWTNLEVLTSGGKFTAVIDRNPAAVSLLGSVVSFTGVCTAIADDRRQLTGIRLWVPSMEYAVVEEATPIDPFGIPDRTIASLRRFSTLKQINRRVHVKGTVIHVRPGRDLTLQEEDATLRVFSTWTEDIKLGDRVEVVGFPGRDNASIVINEAVVRRISGGAMPKPVALSSVRTPLPELDGRLVSIQGTLLDLFSRDNELRLTVDSGDAVVEASLHGRTDVPETGAKLRLTGVYELRNDKNRQPAGFRVLLRSRSDIEVLAAAPWWTARRALAAAAVFSAASLLALGGIVVMRRRIQAQTRQIRQQWANEENLRALHSDIVENASDFIFTTDAFGYFTSFNAAGEHLTGYSRDDARRLKLGDILTPGEEHATPAAAEGRPVSSVSQGRLQTRDGRTIWVETAGRPILQRGTRVGELGIVRDISKRKMIEEELKNARDAAETSAKSKSLFLANMSHELRTPMNGVIGMTNLLLETKLKPDQRDFAETIRNSAESLLTILNDILDFSKIEAGKLRFESLDFDLRDVIDGSIELLAPRASSKQLALSTFLPPETPSSLRGDASRLRQVILNIVGNAIKFTEKGEVSLSVSAAEETGEDVLLRFEVRDTGIGLSEDARNRLFSPFTQADDSTTRRFGGTGLGLVISRQILEMMGGSIGVESTPGSGSLFWFTARFARQPKGGTRPPLAQLETLQGLTVLVVQANETSRKVLHHYAAGFGMHVFEASDADSALELLRRPDGRAWDIVICEYQMPGKDGVMMRREMNADPRLAKIPFVLLTAFDRRVAGTDLGALAIADLLTTPVRHSDFAQALLRAVGAIASKYHGAAGESRKSGASSGGKSALKSLRILMAEDNLVNQRVTALQLQKLGHRADLAADGTEVLEAVERSHYDVILMDCHMPELDGFETTRRLRSHPRHRGMQIIAMTANAMDGDREACLAAGMDDYLSKPTRVEELDAALRRRVAAMEGHAPDNAG